MSNDPGATATKNRVALAVLGAVAVGLAAVLVLALRPPPQIGPNDAVFKTVDALYTAVREQDAKLLSDCEARLTAHRAVGALPAAAAARLDAIIATARSGAWQTAAERLYEFMLGQRRDGP